MRLLLQVCVCVFTLLAVFIVHADQLIIEPDMGRTPVIDAINKASHSIDLVMYGFTDTQLLNAIEQQKKNGRSVKVILEQSPYKAEDENRNAFRQFSDYHIDWRGSVSPFRLIHQKTLILDDNKALVMTFNFTHSAFTRERNFALVIDDPQRVNAIENMFSADWNKNRAANSSSSLIYSPDDSREKLLELIRDAGSAIRIYAQDINDYKIVGALAKAARRGVQVQILTSGKMRTKQAEYLARAGVSMRGSSNYLIHAKVMIIDAKQAVIGSINFTRASLDDNRELSVITSDRNVINQLNQTFDRDWGAGPVPRLGLRKLIRRIILKNPHIKQVLNQFP